MRGVQASVSTEGRGEKMGGVVEGYLERELELLGLTGVEDKLQEGVRCVFPFSHPLLPHSPSLPPLLLPIPLLPLHPLSNSSSLISFAFRLYSGGC